MSNNTLGERIKYHRTRLHMTQEQLAERMGVSAQAVSKWEHNQSCPDISILPDLADLFGISVDELLGKASSQKVHEAEVVDEKPNTNWTWNWTPYKKSNILFAIYILVIGGLMLMNNICNYDVSRWDVIWTMAVAFIGIIGLLKDFSVFSLVLSLSGVYFLLSKYDVLPFSLKWGYVFPAIVLLWGISLLIDNFRGKRHFHVHYRPKDGTDGTPRHECNCTDGYLDYDLSFGTYRAVVATELLKGGKIDASFGQFTIDFSACKAIAADCTIEIDQSFGSLTLLIPKNYLAEIKDDDKFMASVEIEGTPVSFTYGTIHLKLDNSFGAFKIRYID